MKRATGRTEKRKPERKPVRPAGGQAGTMPPDLKSGGPPSRTGGPAPAAAGVSASPVAGGPTRSMTTGAASATAVSARRQVDEFLQEHRDLMHVIADLMTFWSEVDQYGKGPRYQDMACNVRCLREKLADHFAAEEAGGYLAPALQIAPRFSSEAETLRRQHAEFLDRLDRCGERLNSGGFDRWDDVRSELNAFLADLKQHEGEENRLMQVAFCQDVGPGD